MFDPSDNVNLTVPAFNPVPHAPLAAWLDPLMIVVALALAGYAVINGLNLYDACKAMRCGQPCRAKWLKFLGYLAITTKALVTL
ncbi:MAG: hypothetical protein K2X11_21880 [Acetobacteraceae bacterium]|nr:hypothetical protein [Acetobacteraceae bacterium]